LRLSREKIVHLSHIMADFLENEPKTKLIAPKNEIRLMIVELITKEMKKDAAADLEAREKIRTMKDDIPEGSPEWDVLYYKLYQEALDHARKVR
jgi:hypothetical protein